MLADELQNISVESFGLLPVDRVRRLGEYDELGAGDTGELAAHDPGRALQVLISGHEKRWHADLCEFVEGDCRALRLCRLSFLLRIVVDLQPALQAFGIGRHVAHADFAELRRAVFEIWQVRVLAQLGQLFVDDGAAAGGDDQTAQPLRVPEHVVVGGEAAARHGNKMEPIDLQVFHQGVEILADRAGLGAGVRIRGAAAPAATVESDGALSGRDQSRNIVLPAVGVPGVGVEQQDRNAGAAGVRVPEAHAGEIGMSGKLCSRGHKSIT